MFRGRSRKGFTLIEVIAVIGAISIMAVSGAILMTLILDLSSSQRARSNSLNAQERLLDIFSADAKKYGSPETVGDIPKSSPRVIVRWKIKDGTIDYQSGQNDRDELVIHRIETQSGRVVRRETYTIRNNVHVEYYQGTGDNKDLIALSLWESPRNTTISKEQLDPFTGTISESLGKQVDPRYAGNWRTSIVRVANRSK